MRVAHGAPMLVRRENNTGGFPRGLNQYLRALRYWLYGLSPLEPLQWEGPLVGCKSRQIPDP